VFGNILGRDEAQERTFLFAFTSEHDDFKAVIKTLWVVTVEFGVSISIRFY
jgi:hypothetical protein